MQPDDVMAAADGADVIVHGVNPPGYRNWRGLALPMLESSIAAAKAFGARPGDFFGPRTGNSWFAQGLIKPGKPVRSILYPGKPAVGHAWAYLPDVAATIAQLLEREAGLESFEVFHFAGQWCEPGIEMAHAIQRATGEPKPSIRRFPWGPGLRPQSICHRIPGDAGTPLSVEAPDAARQCRARRIPRRRAAHAHRCGRACDAGWTRLPA
jgi:hypothetical protein